MKDRFTLTTPWFTLEGRSRAGHETWFRIRELGLAFDIGRCPDEIVAMDQLFITHAHLDHAVGVPFYAGQRHLQGLEGGTVYLPEASAAEMRGILAGYARMTGSSGLGIDVVGVGAGEEIACGRNHVVRGWPASHRVPALGWELLERRHHLRDEYRGLDGDALATLRRAGTAIEEETVRPLFFYTGDTDREIFGNTPALFRAPVLLIECSFVAEGHQERAERYRHLHIDDLAEVADRFENELIVLTHFSRRYSRAEIQEGVRRRTPASLHERIRLALPEPFQRL